MARRAASEGSEMTTQRAPFKTRRWTEAEDAALRSLVEAGTDARMIGKELNRSFMGVHARVKKLKLTIVVKKRKNFSPGSLWRWGVKANASSEGNEMNRLRRFYEKVPYGRTSSRVAYVTNRAESLKRCQTPSGPKTLPSTQAPQFSPTPC